MGWAESLLQCWEAPAIYAKVQSLSHPHTLPEDPRPVSKESESRNQKALSMEVCGKAGQVWAFPRLTLRLGYWDREGSSSFRTPPTRCRLPVTRTWMAAASRRMLAPLLAVGWLRRLLGGFGG